MTALPLRATPAPWAALAAALGDHWRHVPDPAAAGYARPGGYALLEGRGDELLLVTDPDIRAGISRDERDVLPVRVRVVGLFDRLHRRCADVTHADCVGVDTPHVTQALTKPAHVIARAIARDMLPGYRAALTQAIENATERQARAAAADALLARLAAYQPAALPAPRHPAAWGAGRRRLYLRLSGDDDATVEIAESAVPRVTFKIETRDPDRAAALMAIIAGPMGEAT